MQNEPKKSTQSNAPAGIKAFYNACIRDAENKQLHNIRNRDM